MSDTKISVSEMKIEKHRHQPKKTLSVEL